MQDRSILNQKRKKKSESNEASCSYYQFTVNSVKRGMCLKILQECSQQNYEKLYRTDDPVSSRNKVQRKKKRRWRDNL